MKKGKVKRNRKYKEEERKVSNKQKEKEIKGEKKR